MPTNKRESLIFTFIMCFAMVLWMSIYNVALHQGALTMGAVAQAWLGFPVAYVFAMCADWFVAAPLAKGFAVSFFGDARQELAAGHDAGREQLHGCAHGDHHVAVRRGRGRFSNRRVCRDSLYVDFQHPHQLHHGAAVEPAGGGARFSLCIPPGVPRWHRSCLAWVDGMRSAA